MFRIILIATLSASLAGCSMFRRKNAAVQPPPPQTSATPEAAVDTSTAEPAHEASEDGGVSSHGNLVPPPPISPQIPAQTHSQQVAEGIPPEKALGWLKNGNKRFLKGYWRKDGATKGDVKRLTSGQQPHTVIVSCSDSRVPPEVIFDQKLGEIFVVRSAGEIVEDAGIASVEYAVQHLGARLILVMGHNRCGAVRAALETMTTKEAGSPHLNKLVANIHGHFGKLAGKVVSKDLSQESWANAEGVAQDLMEKSAIIQEKIKAGQLQIRTALYSIDNGRVDFDQTEAH